MMSTARGLVLCLCIEMLCGSSGSVHAGERLSNGIELPDEWPPQIEQLSNQPSVPPYLKSPPAVIEIDVGRQLFVDDFLIEETTLERVFHKPVYYEKNPVLKADRPWELGKQGRGEGPVAMPFSDGVWFDPKDQLFKLWYLADYKQRHLCLATSKNGIRWEKPEFGVVPGTNIVFEKPGDARTVWLDQETKDPEQRYKLIITRGGDDIIKPGQAWYGSKCRMYVYFSPDGIHWSEEKSRGGPTGDRNTAFYNPFRKQWVFSIRDVSPVIESDRPVRSRRYWESPDLLTRLPWEYDEPTMWVGSDKLDPIGPRKSLTIPELYNLEVVAYESLMVGLFAILHDHELMSEWRPKINELFVGFSRDGFHWDRSNREVFLGVSEEKRSWNWGNVQSAGGCFLVVGDELYFYVSGRAGDPPHFQDGNGSTGLAKLRRDGFASMESHARKGTLETRPLRFSGKHLFANVATGEGELRAEVLDSEGKAIEPFTLANCSGLKGDTTRGELRWKGVGDLSAITGKVVRLRFELSGGGLYSFWVSPDAKGTSGGYVAAGGPGFPGPRDVGE